MKIKDLIFQIESIRFSKALEYIVENAQNSTKKVFIVTINPELIMLARNDSEYERILKSSDLALNDGVGVTIAGKIMGKSFKGRVHGADLVEKLPEAIGEKPITVGFLGGRGNVAQLAADCLKAKYPSLKVAFALEEWPENDKNLKCDVLFVAFGSPKQEKWINDNKDKVNAKVLIGIGGAFDFISGRIQRAPLLIRKIGFEWLFRLVLQPWRIKRQIVLPYFVLLVLKEKFIG